jgi:long-subunit acyl-CoA synthetase (AMP-forming)
LKPTVFCSVPRLFNRIYDKVLAGVKAKGGVSAYLFNTAFAAKKANLNKSVHHWLWDRVVFGGVSFLLLLLINGGQLLNPFLTLDSPKAWRSTSFYS